jgi:hypothetical protein
VVKLEAAADSKFVSERSAGSSPARGTIEFHSNNASNPQGENKMSYRKLVVDGQVFEYSIGKTHTKIRGVGAFQNREVGYVISDREVRVRPNDITSFIKQNRLKVKS